MDEKSRAPKRTRPPGESSPSPPPKRHPPHSSSPPPRSPSPTDRPSSPASATSRASFAAPPPPPPTPQPWIWRCHVCRAVFRLGCTRRCLRCGHAMCDGLRRARGGKGACGTEFDYEGWAAWGRRRARPVMVERDYSEEEVDDDDDDEGEDVSAGGVFGRKRKAARRKRRLGEGGWSCWRDCDYPSECFCKGVRPRRESSPLDCVNVDEEPVSPLALSPSMEAARAMSSMDDDEAELIFSARVGMDGNRTGMGREASRAAQDFTIFEDATADEEAEMNEWYERWYDGGSDEELEDIVDMGLDDTHGW